MPAQSGPPAFDVRQFAGSVPASSAGTFDGRKRHTFPQRPFASHTDPWPTRIASPPGPSNLLVTSFVIGSMRVTGTFRDVTQTDPSPAAMSPPVPGTPA